LNITELFAWFDQGVINNMDDGLSISLAVTCDQQHAPSGCTAAV